MKMNILLLFCFLGFAFAVDREMIYTQLKAKIELDCEGDNIYWRTKTNSTAAEYADLLATDGNDISIEENSLTLEKLTDDQIGLYACFDSDDNMIKEFQIEVQYKIKKMVASVSVNKGSATPPGEITCTTVGIHEVIFKWYTRPEGSDEDSELTQICGVDGDNCNSRIEPTDPQLSEIKENEMVTTPAPFLERISIMTQKNTDGFTSELKIENAQMEDRAVYVCRAIAKEFENDEDLVCSESHNCEEVFTLLRVKDPLAAVWPFIGIVAEVVILCLVIFFCEKRKKDEEAKEDMDDDRYAGNNISSNNSLRQRK
eukprot:TRINITY_DN23007_c0_g1_i11.p1 TRINITY_DN23007_c0_g1~~TRINITY_DN23007_c0_g1_i11.p1  ORF type:complete len:314 (-),score=88.10 TRINITY_DN23007_c0_g1_i11:204-1145(-)